MTRVILSRSRSKSFGVEVSVEIGETPWPRIMRSEENAEQHPKPLALVSQQLDERGALGWVY